VCAPLFRPATCTTHQGRKEPLVNTLTLTYTACSQQEIAEFERFSKQERLHDALFSRIAPNIFGAEDIKRAVACLLFGGSRKVGWVSWLGFPAEQV
jgi:DNA replicative helicase MCM subunit Mcm2 (Cdc46/Mcm family)